MKSDFRLNNYTLTALRYSVYLLVRDFVERLIENEKHTRVICYSVTQFSHN